MSTNRKGCSAQMQLRLREVEQRVMLESASEQNLIAAIAELLHAAAQTDPNRAAAGDDHDE
jgi:hypothetical protein